MSRSVNDISAWVLQCHDQLVGKKCVKCRAIYPDVENLITRSIFVKQHWLFKERQSQSQSQDQVEERSYDSEDNSYESDDNTGDDANGGGDGDADGDSTDTAVQSPNYQPASPIHEFSEEQSQPENDEEHDPVVSSIELSSDRSYLANDVGAISPVMSCFSPGLNANGNGCECEVEVEVEAKVDEGGGSDTNIGLKRPEFTHVHTSDASDVNEEPHHDAAIANVGAPDIKCDICWNTRKHAHLYNKQTCPCNVVICLKCSIELVNCPFCRLTMRPHVKGTVDLKVQFSDLIVLTRSPFYTESLINVTNLMALRRANGVDGNEGVDFEGGQHVRVQSADPPLPPTGHVSETTAANTVSDSDDDDSDDDSFSDSDSDVGDEEHNSNGESASDVRGGSNGSSASTGTSTSAALVAVAVNPVVQQSVVVLLHYNGNIVRTHIPSLLPDLETRVQKVERFSLSPRIVRESLRPDLLRDVSSTTAHTWLKLAYASAAVIYAWEGTGVDTRGNMSVSMPVQLLQDLFQYFTCGLRALITLNKLKRHITIVKLAFVICITLRKAMRVSHTRLTFAENLNWLEENDILNAALSMLRNAKRHSTSYERLLTEW